MMTIKLYPYQKKLVNEARSYIAKGSKGVLIQSPPGSGKSVVIAKIAKSATDKKNHVMFIVHRKELVKQINETFKIVGVDPNYSTIMTVGKVANRLEVLPVPTIIITDETHHSRAATYKKVYDYHPDAIRLGFTATPWRMSGKGFKDIYDSIVLGEQVDWLIDNKFLAPYEYYAPNLTDLDELKKASTGDYTKKSMDKAVSNVIFGDIVKHYQKLASDKKAILYAHSVDASYEIAEAFKANGIKAIHADAKTPAKERDEIMNNFKNGDLQVLCNVDLVSEGFNVPDCSCVILVRPTASLVLYLQQSMRAMRYQDGKKATIIDHVGNVTMHKPPSHPHDWSIEDRAKQTKKSNTTNESPHKQCEYCHRINPTAVIYCEGCGEEFPVATNNLEFEDAELEKIDISGFKTNYQAIRIKRKYGNKRIEDLKTLEEFYLFAKSRNYKDGWIKYNFPPLKTSGWIQFNGHLNPLKEKYKNIFN